MDIFCISGTEIAPAYIKSMPETMPETHLTSRIWNAISGISIRCYLYLNPLEIGVNGQFFCISGPVNCPGINEFNVGNYAGNSSHILHLECNIRHFHRIPFLYLNSSEISINGHFLRFRPCKLPRHKQIQCRKLCRKPISHLAFAMQYLAFPSGAICT